MYQTHGSLLECQKNGSHTGLELKFKAKVVKFFEIILMQRNLPFPLELHEERNP